jgi:hypothetical protein
MNNTLRLLTNIALFQIGWFACLLLTTSWAVMVTAVILLLHFYFIVPCDQRRKEINIIAVVLMVGVVMESIYLFGQVLIRVDGEYFPAFWLLFIWILFSTTFRYSLSWLRPTLWLASAFAAVVAPMSYYAGANINASVSLNENIFFSLAVIAISWAIAFPILMKILVSTVNRET